VKVFLLVDRKRHVATLPYAHADHVLVTGRKCPHCGCDPFGVAGRGRRASADDRAWEADASCTNCGRAVGLLRAEPDTLFGVTEDEAVLKGRCRVY
jgi:hypothetical protein